MFNCVWLLLSIRTCSRHRAWIEPFFEIRVVKGSPNSWIFCTWRLRRHAYTLGKHRKWTWELDVREFYSCWIRTWKTKLTTDTLSVSKCMIDEFCDQLLYDNEYSSIYTYLSHNIRSSSTSFRIEIFLKSDVSNIKDDEDGLFRREYRQLCSYGWANDERLSFHCDLFGKSRDGFLLGSTITEDISTAFRLIAR